MGLLTRKDLRVLEAEIAASEKTKRDRRTFLEQVVRTRYDATLEFLSAITEIKVNRLWAIDYATWRDYCDAKFPMTGRSADRLIRAHRFSVLPEPPRDTTNSESLESTFAPGTLSGTPQDIVNARPGRALPDATGLAPVEPKPWSNLASGVEKLEGLLRDLATFRRRIQGLMDDPALVWLQLQSVTVPVRDAETAIKNAMPAGPCGYCEGGALQDCKGCTPSGSTRAMCWLPLERYVQQPEEMRTPWPED